MKNIQLIAVVAALGFMAVAAQAHDVALSPKAAEMRSRGLTGGTEVRQTFEFVRGNKNASPRIEGMASKDDRNLVREQRGVVYTGKGAPGGAPRQFEVAPVK